jgi:Mrp family chromosome partitioning ATPase
VVLLDSPPLLTVSDAVPLVELADGVVVVARLGRTTRAAAHRTVDLLERIPGARVLGVVADDLSRQEFGAGAYGYYGYGYGSGD